MKKVKSLFLVLVMMVSLLYSFIPASSVESIEAATLSYPAQMIRIGAYNSNRNLNISAMGENSNLNTWITNGVDNEKWRVDYVSSGVYEIVNMATGKYITASGSSAVIATKNNSDSQKWYIQGVEKDFLGNYLYYKIASYSNSNLVLTYNSTTNVVGISTYVSANSQKWKLNCDGLEGFAGNCKVSEGEKAGVIGGLLGETVFVSDLQSFKSALLRTEPLTIVITKNIEDCNSEVYDLRIEDNKTIIGSYAANTLVDPRLRTDDYFKQELVSNNIILKNINVEVKNREDVVAFAVYGSDNVWVDHCTFNNSLSMEYDEVGKFIWVNTSTYSNKNPDFVTLSYNVFSHRFWGIAFGTTTGVDEDRATVMYNYFDSIVHRAPQLGNGTLHVYNNYYVRNDGSIYNDGFASIKCGAGSVVYSDANCFESYKKESSGYWDNEVTVDSAATFKDVGSYTNKSTNGGGSFYAYTAPSCSVTTWNPATNYGYKIITAYGGNDVMSFCKAYSGEVTSQSELKYITDSSCSSYINKNISSPFLQSNVDTSNTDSSNTDTLDGKTVMFKNVNSNLYLEVTGGSASNGTNVQQWGAYGAASHNTWKLVSNGNGYYYIYSQVGDGDTYLLDVANNSAASGTNIQIWENTYCNAQLFKLVQNIDGTYTIYTKASNDSSCVEIQDGSTSSGGNVQQWGYAGGNWQKWYIEIV